MNTRSMHRADPAAGSSGAAPANPLLSGPIVPAMVRLALPTIGVLVVQTFVGIAETYFVGFLGTDALAGVALVFPVLMLMQMMSNGGIGGGVASAVARARGSGRQADAEAILWHAIVLAFGFGLAFMLAALACSPALYAAMGGKAGSLQAALTYSTLVFAGSVPLWVLALSSAALRGAGNVNVPALVALGGALLLLPLSPALIFGWGPLPHLGVAGGGGAVLLYYVLGAAALIAFLRSRHSPIALRAAPLRYRHFKDILGVGLLSAVGTVQSNLTVTLITAAVGLFGAQAIAGYGIASRLDYLLIPLLFGWGTAVVTMVGTNIGAGQAGRARRIAWTGAALAFLATESIGLLVALRPDLWAGMFSDDPAVLALATLYLQRVAPFYGAIGAGMILYFAGQGARRVLVPVVAGTVRMVVAAGFGWLAIAWFGIGLPRLFEIVALSSLLFGAIIAVALRFTRWA